MSLADGEIIAFLDDDCTVASDWIDSIEETTARYPKATLFFGSFIAAPHDWTAYYTPSHSIIEEEQIDGSGAYVSHASGVGGNMCLRRSQLFDYDAFDVCLGAGAKTFHSGEDVDLFNRVLVTNRCVVKTPHIRVQHHGMRSHQGGSSRRLVRASVFSLGAVDAKLVRCGKPRARTKVLKSEVEKHSRSQAWQPVEEITNESSLPALVRAWTCQKSRSAPGPRSLSLRGVSLCAPSFRTCW